MEQVKIKNLLTIPAEIRERYGEVIRKTSEGNSEVLVGNRKYILKDRYFEKSSKRNTIL